MFDESDRSNVGAAIVPGRVSIVAPRVLSSE